MTAKTVGLDIAKNIFHVRGVNAAGGIDVRRLLRRWDMPRWFADVNPAIVGIELSAYCWTAQQAIVGQDGGL